jgi:hypothetical protein
LDGRPERVTHLISAERRWIGPATLLCHGERSLRRTLAVVREDGPEPRELANRKRTVQRERLSLHDSRPMPRIRSQNQIRSRDHRRSKHARAMTVRVDAQLAQRKCARTINRGAGQGADPRARDIKQPTGTGQQ